MKLRTAYVKKETILIITGIIIATTQFVFGEDKSSYQLERITVTAEKREADIQDVPAAISVLTEMNLEDAMIDNVDDVISEVPNMVIDHMAQGYSSVNVRGINSSVFTRKNPVVVYIDGIPLDYQMPYDADLVNVERVEVLRGPQGTLYGKNTIGGIINVVSKKPGNTYEAKATAEIGEHETYRLKAFVNGPLIKNKLFLGLSGDYYETRGFMKNDHPVQDYFDDEETRKAKAIFRWLPTDRIEVNLLARIDQRRDGGGSKIAADTVRYHEFRNPGDKSDTDNISSGLNINYSGDFADFKSITTYSDTKTDFLMNRGFLNIGSLDDAFETETDALTQELRIQSPDMDERLKWIGGLYYSRELRDHIDCSSVYDTVSSYGYNLKFNWPGDTEEETMAVFGQLTLPLPAKVDFTAGARYEKTYKELNYRYEVSRTDTGAQMGEDPFSPGTTLPATYNVDDEWETVLPKGVLSWTPSPDAMIYASAAKGYLAGGFNAYGNDKNKVKFDEQTSINYELGAKTAWFDNRLYLNSTLFYIDIEDMHVWSTPSPGVWVASNAAKAHSQGLEVEAKIRPAPGLDITAAVGLIQAEFDDYKKSSMDYAGKKLLNTPEYTFNLAVQYRHALGLFIRGEAEGYGKTYYDEANTFKRDAYIIYNAKIGYEGSNWDLYLYGHNLLDEAYFNTIYAYGGTASYGVGEPRKFGIIASVRL